MTYALHLVPVPVVFFTLFLAPTRELINCLDSIGFFLSHIPLGSIHAANSTCEMCQIKPISFDRTSQHKFCQFRQTNRSRKSENINSSRSHPLFCVTRISNFHPSIYVITRTHSRTHARTHIIFVFPVIHPLFWAHDLILFILFRM